MDEKVKRALVSVLDKLYLDKYEQDLDRIWRDVIHLNSNYYILEKINSFPFDLINEETTFWEVTYTSIYESSILIIWRLLQDNQSATSMTKFRNDIVWNLIDNDYKEIFLHDRRKYSLRAIEKKYSSKIEKIRHNRLAHSNKDYFSWSLLPSFANNIEIKLDDIQKIKNVISEYFDLLCLTVGRGQWPIEYMEHSVGLEHESDIDRILRLLLKDNCLVNMPEEQEESWPLYKDHNLTNDDLVKLNELRNLIGLPEVL